jgi:drug/metabolite transporter (DMT)-like permease
MTTDLAGATASDRTERLLAGAAPVIFLVLWSAGFGFAKVGLEHAGPMTLLAWRYGLVVALMLPAWLILRPPLPGTPWAWLHLIVVGCLIQVVYFGLGMTSMAMGVPVGMAAVIASLQPITVCLASPVVTGEKIGALKWLGIFVGLSGSLLVITSRSQIEIVGSLALLLCFGSMLAMAAATLYQKRFGAAEHVVTANLVQYLTGFVFVLPMALAFEGGSISWTADFAIALAYLVIANSLISISLLLFMLRRGQASRVSSLFFLIPPTAALSGWLLLGETLGAVALCGMAISAFGVALVLRS